jgi:WS/DGAT/MGAT family acyltransferase
VARRDAIEGVLSGPLRRDRPLWDVVSIEAGRAAPASIVLRAHHCILDGMSGIRLVEMLSTPLDAAAATVGTARLEASPNGRNGRPRRPRSSTQEEAPLWESARSLAELTTTCVSLLHDHPAPATPLNGVLGGRRRAVWATFAHADLFGVRAKTGATVNDVALAVITGALRRYLWRHRRSASQTSLRAVVPVSLRPPCDELALGNAISAMFPRLPVEVADPLARLERITAETTALKDRGQPRATAFAMALAGGLPPALGAMLPRLLPDTPLFNTVCTSVPGPTTPRPLGGRRIVG